MGPYLGSVPWRGYTLGAYLGGAPWGRTLGPYLGGVPWGRALGAYLEGVPWWHTLGRMPWGIVTACLPWGPTWGSPLPWGRSLGIWLGVVQYFGDAPWRRGNILWDRTMRACLGGASWECSLGVCRGGGTAPWGGTLAWGHLEDVPWALTLAAHLADIPRGHALETCFWGVPWRCTVGAYLRGIPWGHTFGRTLGMIGGCCAADCNDYGGISSRGSVLGSFTKETRTLNVQALFG